MFVCTTEHPSSYVCFPALHVLAQTVCLESRADFGHQMGFIPHLPSVPLLLWHQVLISTTAAPPLPPHGASTVPDIPSIPASVTPSGPCCICPFRAVFVLAHGMCRAGGVKGVQRLNRGGLTKNIKKNWGDGFTGFQCVTLFLLTLVEVTCQAAIIFMVRIE